MVDQGAISDAEAASHPLRNRVFSCLGGDVPPHIEVSPAMTLRDGDLIALCTDGAWSPLGETLVAELGRASPDTTVPRLLDAAERAAGPGADNLTLITMRWEAHDPDADTNTLDRRPAEQKTATETPISDEDIENAIATIRRRIPLTPNGASS
jgi:serine/threonine protein phosphatase PrpC